MSCDYVETNEPAPGDSVMNEIDRSTMYLVPTSDRDGLTQPEGRRCRSANIFLSDARSTVTLATETSYTMCLLPDTRNGEIPPPQWCVWAAHHCDHGRHGRCLTHARAAARACAPRRLLPSLPVETDPTLIGLCNNQIQHQTARRSTGSQFLVV